MHCYIISAETKCGWLFRGHVTRAKNKKNVARCEFRQKPKMVVKLGKAGKRRIWKIHNRQ